MQSEFKTTSELKTYPNSTKLLKKNNNSVPLTTKNAVKYLLEGSLKFKVCRYCLNVAYPLSEIDEILEIGGRYATYELTVKDMIASFHPFKVEDNEIFPNKICSDCLDRAISSYLFTQQCERSERALRNCFDDIQEKYEKLDPLNAPKKRGRQKLNPNYNFLYVEHRKVIDYAEPIINLINVGANPVDENKSAELQCPKCWQVLPNFQSLMNHQSMHPKTMWYHCRKCGKSFVKFNHLKRHIRDVHDKGLVKSSSKGRNDFACRECGYSSNTLGQHLQHIEKHKFKETFMNLIERKTDLLCAVCFEKSPKLVGMDERVHLHGGYPELAGEKNLYGMLPTIFPEPKSYKYQELLVPSKAKIIKIMKKRFSTQELNCAIASKKPRSSNVVLSETDSLRRFELDFKQIYTFEFSKPEYSFENSNVYICDFINTEPINAFVNEPSNNCTAENDCYEIVSLEPSELDSKSNISVDPKIINNPCKTCWIFNKPACSTCIANSINSDSKNVATMESKSNTEDCKLCWVFKNAGKCDNCKKIFKNNTDTINKQNYEKHLVVEAKTELKVSVKWSCKVCLTNNDGDRESCYCCESKNVILPSIDFKFNKNNDSNNLLPKDETASDISNDFFKRNNKCTEIVPKITNSYNLAATVTKNDFNKHLSKQFEHADTNIKAAEISFVEDNKIEKDISPMDIEIINNELNTTNNLNHNSIVSIDEQMDISEYGSPSNFNMTSIDFPPNTEVYTNMPSTSFAPITFNIGSNIVKKKDTRMKPLRRIATRSHK